MQVFCTPASQADGSWTALADPQAAAYAADGCARATGEPTCVVTEGLAAALSAASACLTSAGDRVPLVVVTRLPERSVAATRGPFAAVASGSTVVASHAHLDELARKIEADGIGEPLHIALVGGPGPAVVVARIGSLRLRPRPRPLRDGAVAEVVAALSGTERPVILVGAGAVDADPEILAKLSATLGAPALLSASATTMSVERLGVFRDAFESADVPLIPSGTLVWVKALARADVVLALGSALSEVDWFGLEEIRISRARIIRVAHGRTARELGRPFVDADAGAMAEALVGELPATRSRGGLERIRRAVSRWREGVRGEAERAGLLERIEPRFAAHEIVRGAPSQTVFVAEGGASGMWLWANLWLRPLVFPVQHGTIGVPVPMALGIATALPDRPVWAVVGDGAFFYNVAELSSLAAHGHAPVFFVFDDSSWSAIRLGQTFLFRGRYVGTDLPETDYASLATLHGCEAITVRSPRELRAAVSRAAAHDGTAPLVVVIEIGKDHVPYAGASFVLAELDGVVRSLGAGALLGTVLGMGKGTLSLDTIRSILRVGR